MINACTPNNFGKPEEKEHLRMQVHAKFCFLDQYCVNVSKQYLSIEASRSDFASCEELSFAFKERLRRGFLNRGHERFTAGWALGYGAVAPHVKIKKIC